MAKDKRSTQYVPIDCATVDWRGVTAALFSDVATHVFVALHDYVNACHAETTRTTPDEEAPGEDDRADERDDRVDERVRQAAVLLGVSVDASADEVRAALRAKLATSRLHPDQGGDGEAAARLIAAKNFLVERWRSREVRS